MSARTSTTAAGVTQLSGFRSTLTSIPFVSLDRVADDHFGDV
jgi:hypothetical protein